MTDRSAQTPTNSLIVPVYRNESGIPALLNALAELHRELAGDLEVVFVVDGSPDQSWVLLRDALPSQAFPSQLLLLSRNFGSFAAIRRGLEVASGNHLAVMAADLQEPPELMLSFFRILGEGETDVVVGKRIGRADGFFTKLASGLFWRFYRRWIVPEMPVGGVDVFGCSSRTRDELLSLGEAHSSLVAQLFWLGGRRREVPFERRPRMHGKSAWGVSRKLRYMLDSVLAFSDLPIFVLLWVGVVALAASIGVGLIVFTAWVLGMIEVPGYTPVVLLISLIGSVLIVGQGIIGSYVWRANENTKQRPLSLTRSQENFEGIGLSSGSTLETQTSRVDLAPGG